MSNRHPLHIELVQTNLEEFMLDNPEIFAGVPVPTEADILATLDAVTPEHITSPVENLIFKYSDRLTGEEDALS